MHRSITNDSVWLAAIEFNYFLEQYVLRNDRIW